MTVWWKKDHFQLPFVFVGDDIHGPARHAVMQEEERRIRFWRQFGRGTRSTHPLRCSQ